MRYLSLLVFTAGAVILGMELSASRLIEPAFGNNQVIWAALIGLILLYLALGGWLGGYLADRFPHRRELDLTMTIAAIGVALIPALSNPVLRMAATGLSNFSIGLLGGATITILLLFSLPGILLGTASPWAIRLSLQDIQHSGRTTGRLYALATAGSLIGAFVPVLWLIPMVGTRWTFYLLALALLTVVTLGSLTRRHRWIPLTALILVLLLAILTGNDRSIRGGWDDGSAGTILYEDESVYNYIVVRQWGSERHLKLNDGIGLHSVYHPDMFLSRGIWDYILLAPLFRPLESATEGPDNALVIGLAAGTVGELLTRVYGPIPITGIELDPQIIEVGRRFFAMNQPNLTAVAADGRRWLAGQPASANWDLIAVDAYRPPYIPFHLTTVEFFELVRSHLSPGGVVAVNVGRTATNFALVDSMAATMAEVFPAVYIIDEPGPAGDLGSSLVVGVVQPVSLEDFRSNIAGLPGDIASEFRQFAGEAAGHARHAQPPADSVPFYDNRAPVERVVHGIILDFLRGE